MELASRIARLSTLLLLAVLFMACVPSTRYMAMARRAEVTHPSRMTTDELLGQITAELRANDPMDASALMKFLDTSALTPTQHRRYPRFPR